MRRVEDMYANVSEEYSNNLGSFATRDFNIFVNSKIFKFVLQIGDQGGKQRRGQGRGGEERIEGRWVVRGGGGVGVVGRFRR